MIIRLKKISLLVALGLFMSCSIASMQEQQKKAAEWATKELHKRMHSAYDQWTLCIVERRKQFCIDCEKGLLPMVEHLIKMGANPHFAHSIKIHAIREHYIIESHTALGMAKDLNLSEITHLLEAIPKDKEKIR